MRRNDYAVLAITGILMFTVNYTLPFWAELHVSSGLAAVLQATIPIFGMIFAHWMLPDEPLRLQKLAGAIIALGGVALICARLLGFNGPLAFWGGVGVVIGAASAAYANVVVKARSIQLAPAMLAAWQMILALRHCWFLGLSWTETRHVFIGLPWHCSACCILPLSGRHSRFFFFTGSCHD
jgi:drug/metabolite transporter (DMT)-like permease